MPEEALGAARTKAGAGVVGRHEWRVTRRQHVAQVSDLQVVCTGTAARQGGQVVTALASRAGGSGGSNSGGGGGSQPWRT